jgi:hypothetical protein
MKNPAKTLIIVLFFLLGSPYIGFSQNGLIGTWHVRCPDGDKDIVECVTRNHFCSKCSKPAILDGKGYVVCPYGHNNMVSGSTQSKKCTNRYGNGNICGAECRNDSPFKIFGANERDQLEDELKRKGCL